MTTLQFIIVFAMTVTPILLLVFVLSGVYDRAVDKIRDMLLDGVVVWCLFLIIALGIRYAVLWSK